MHSIEAIKQLENAGLKTRYIALSTFDSEQQIVQALETGAIGYINKKAQNGEVIEAVKLAYNHHPYYCRSTLFKPVTKIPVR